VVTRAIRVLKGLSALHRLDIVAAASVTLSLLLLFLLLAS
jgi:hypothetical protein